MPISGGSSAGSVDVTSVTPGTTASSLGKAEDAAHASGDTGVVLLAVREATATDLSAGNTDGDYEPLQVGATGRLWTASNIDQMNGVAVTMGNGASGTGVQRVTVANDSTGILAGVTTVTTVTTCSTLTGSGIAHDGADSGNPHKIGAVAETALSGVTLVADGDRTNLYAGVDGVLITRPHCNLEDVVTGNASNTDGTSTQVIAAGGAGIKQYLTSFTVTNTSATPTYCELKSATTVKWTVPVPANGGVTHSFSVPLPPNTTNEAWNFDMGAATTTAYCSMVGFKSKV